MYFIKGSPDIPSAHLAQYIVITTLLTIFPVLYLHPRDYSVTTNLYFSIPSPFSPSSTCPLPSDIHQSVLCIYESVFVLFVHLYCSLDSTCKWNQKFKNFKAILKADYEPVETSNYITLILASIAARPVRTLHEALCMCLVIWTAFEAPTITVLTLAYFSNFVFI